MYRCIIPAAGLSERMGENKLLLPFGTGSVISTVITSALNSGCQVLVATGSREEELLGHLTERFGKQSALSFIHNPDYRLGMFSTIHRALSSGIEGDFLILHGDLPCVSAELIRRLIEAKSLRDEDVLRPSHEGVCGHPVLFSRKVASTIIGAGKEGSMREVLKSHTVWEYEVDDPAILLDVDTPAAYQAARQYVTPPAR